MYGDMHLINQRGYQQYNSKTVKVEPRGGRDPRHDEYFWIVAEENTITGCIPVPSEEPVCIPIPSQFKKE